MSEARHQPTTSLRQLAGTMLYVGIAGYGGGPAIIAYLKTIFVNRKGWLTEEEFFTGLSLSQMLPGANALAMVVFLSYRLRGSLGALIAPACFLFPSLVLMTVLSALYFAYGQVSIARALFTGLGAVVVGLLVNALIVMGQSAIKSVPAALVAAAVFLLMHFLHLPITLAIILSAAAGFLLPETNGAAVEARAEIVKTPRAFWLGWAAAFAAFAGMILLTYHTTATQLALAILRTGVLTFGGGYASVPLFQHEAVVAHPWLTNREFLDGLALGQITPGPVLITATFIGYRVLGVFGAVLGTVAVFLPGGLAMYFVAHQHERVKHLRWLRALVRGIVAGFIGVLLSVLLDLALHSITDWKTLLLALASTLILTVAKKDPLWVILGGAVVSLVLFR